MDLYTVNYTGDGWRVQFEQYSESTPVTQFVSQSKK